MWGWANQQGQGDDSSARSPWVGTSPPAPDLGQGLGNKNPFLFLLVSPRYHQPHVASIIRTFLIGVLQTGLTEPSPGLPTPSRKHGGGLLWAEEGAGDGCQGPACHLCSPSWPSSVCIDDHVSVGHGTTPPTLTPQQVGGGIFLVRSQRSQGSWGTPPWQPAQHMCMLGGLGQSPAAPGNPVPSSPPFSARDLGSQAKRRPPPSLLWSRVRTAELSLLTCSVIWTKHLTARSFWFASPQNGRYRFCGENPRNGGHKGLVLGTAADRCLVPTPGQEAPLGVPSFC